MALQRDYYYHAGKKQGRYPADAALGLEAGCKQSGMYWSEPGAENILAFRCLRASRRLDQFWKERLNAHAAQKRLPGLGGVAEEFCHAPRRT